MKSFIANIVLVKDIVTDYFFQFLFVFCAFGMICYVVIMSALGVAVLLHEPEKKPTIVIEQPADIIINYEDVGCVLAQYPKLSYMADTDTVEVMIECDRDILFYYLPAEAPDEKI